MILKHIQFRILKLFWLVNILAYVILWISPLGARIENPFRLFILNFFFLAIVSLVSILFVGGSHVNKKIEYKINEKLILKNSNLLGFLPILGFVFVFYDRVFIRGIDYSENLRSARYEWLASSGGSVISIVGNLLIPLSYISILFLIYFYKYLSKSKRVLLFFASIVGVIGHAALNGGRSNVLLGLAMVVLSIILRNEVKVNKLFRLKYLFIFLLVSWYIVSIIQDSATMGSSVTIKKLTVLNVENLHGRIDPDFLSKNNNTLSYIYLYIIAYLFHGQWTASEMFSLSIRDGYSMLQPLSIVLVRLGLLQEPLQPDCFGQQGIFLSLPGSYYYDGGLFGFIIFCILHGILLGITFHMLNKKRIGLIKLGFIVFTWYLTFLSPILPAFGLAYMQFIIWAFLLLWIINVLLFKKNIILI